MEVLCLVFVLLFSTLCPFSFAIILMEKSEQVALLYFLMSCGSQCSVAFPHGPMGWSAICDCCIS